MCRGRRNPLAAWLAQSVRNKLLAMALLPLLVVLPLLVGALLLWGNIAYDRLLITKVRSDLAVAHGYFDQVVAGVGGGTESVAASHELLKALKARDATGLAQLLDRQRAQLGLDFLVTVPAHQPELLNTEAFSATRGARLAIVDGAQFARLAPHLSSRVPIALIPTRNAHPASARSRIAPWWCSRGPR
jgi:hypothetical protein